MNDYLNMSAHELENLPTDRLREADGVYRRERFALASCIGYGTDVNPKRYSNAIQRQALIQQELETRCACINKVLWMHVMV